MTPNEYQERVSAKETNQEELRYWVFHQGIEATRLSNACRGMAISYGELNGIMKAWLEKRQIQNYHKDIVNKLGDCVQSIAQAASAINVTLEEVMEVSSYKLDQRSCKGQEINPKELVKAVLNLRVEDNGPSTT